MKSESGINNRWELLESVVGVSDLKRKFNAYGWYHDENLRISKDEHWSGWWNDCFNFVNIFPMSNLGVKMIVSIAKLFEKNGYSVEPIINGGASIHYRTMTSAESDEKAKQNLLNGGRMSD